MKPFISTTLSLAAAVVVSFVTSCAPQAFSLNMEMRHPSKAGIDLTGKSIAVVCLEDNTGKDSVFNSYLVSGFASALEREYFSGEKAVNVYSMKKNPSGNYGTADSLVNIVMSTGDDVVFLFDAPDFGNVSVSEKEYSPADTAVYYNASVPLTLTLYAYDSMGKVDTVYTWRGSRNLSGSLAADVYTSSADVADMLWPKLALQAEQAGTLSSKIFMPTWKSEQYTVIYFDSPEAWDTASEAAYNFRWHDAVESWMTLVDTNNLMRRSCAEYNIALGCYMMGDNELALKWLDRSDADYPVSLSSGLRKRIKARMK